ncbi:HhH-GPD family protein [Mucilaginibacter gilvus]|uniref:HhH-GPD domain-containing protein n=1 Tax=Mucilaginibacter gilvus TaxID=2305909 RepID=A0A3S3UT19_9SPHI|nr:hypothetical protein [Mucilaginibacter gilvus]RWY47473.1 hypothetical protein EPL05_21760 [Mucilaginibacter gilvus]
MEPPKKEIRLFQLTILSWFKSNARQFQWRALGLSIYQIVISEVLLQRTKAETVSKNYDIFFKRYPDWNSLNNSNICDIENLLFPFGLYRQRAQRLKALAKAMVENNVLLPNERSLIEKIPLMGQYIANAVELLVFKRNIPLLDVNMARVLERYFGPRKLKDIRFDPYLKFLSREVVDHIKSKEINWAILDFAALICQSRKPKCPICVFQKTCQYHLKIYNLDLDGHQE